MPSLTSGPLLETSLVHVVATCSLAPYQLIAFWLEVHVADRTLAFDWLPLSVLFLLIDVVIWYRWGCIEDLLQLGDKEGSLVLEIVWCLEDRSQGLHLVLAFVALPTVWTGACRNFVDCDAVDVPCAADNVNVFGRAVVSAGARAANDNHPV